MSELREKRDVWQLLEHGCEHAAQPLPRVERRAKRALPLQRREQPPHERLIVHWCCPHRPAHVVDESAMFTVPIDGRARARDNLLRVALGHQPRERLHGKRVAAGALVHVR